MSVAVAVTVTLVSGPSAHGGQRGGRYVTGRRRVGEPPKGRPGPLGLQEALPRTGPWAYLQHYSESATMQSVYTKRE